MGGGAVVFRAGEVRCDGVKRVNGGKEGRRGGGGQVEECNLVSWASSTICDCPSKDAEYIQDSVQTHDEQLGLEG